MTESHRTEFGSRFGDQFPYATYAPEPEDTGIGDQPLSADSNRPGDTESHGTNFGARLGDPFTYITYAAAPDDTEV